MGIFPFGFVSPNETDQFKENSRIFYDDTESLLIEPHGGRLVCNLNRSEVLSDLDGLRKIQVEVMDLMDCEDPFLSFGIQSSSKRFNMDNAHYSTNTL